MFKWGEKPSQVSSLEKKVIESFQDIGRWEFVEKTHIYISTIHYYYDNVLGVSVKYTPRGKTVDIHGLCFIGGEVYAAFTQLHANIQTKILEDKLKSAEALYDPNS
ncbi:MAG: hypothetical protein ACXW1D_00525 [Halobacteriota archaeon]